jgi:hypothetical protein
MQRGSSWRRLCSGGKATGWVTVDAELVLVVELSMTEEKWNNEIIADSDNS